ncbi:hydroxymethylglutaryl-CoA synthase family protein [Candidatus Solincola sp.]|nr:zinc ribbon domain-containing protein [Actinomycetota bacterium]MDI7251870.1 zinc ribbon domain-containing protein [Actinomycetota bacterium]
MVGIGSFGGYVPRYRLNRMIIFGSMGWLNPVIITNARGEKAVANFDEDSITMAVAAGMDCLRGVERQSIDAVYFATTTAPYKERQNANIVAGALGARDEIRSADFTGSLKSGTSALLSALEFVAYNGGKAVVCAADCRLGKMASTQEMVFGDAGAAIMVSDQDVIAEYKGSFSVSHDFVDHLRGANTRYDRMWEERWIRDVGYQQFIPQAVQGLCAKYGLNPSDFDRIIYPCYYGGARKNINKVLQVEQEKVQDDMLTTVGDSGSAHPLLMLAAALENAKPGEKILLVSYGSGCDALWFEVTDNITKMQDGRGVSRWLARRADLDNYQKYLVWRGMAPAETGIRGETDKETRWSLVWREHKAILGLWGSKCRKCGTQQYPPQRICINPDCQALDEMDPVYLADKGGTVFTYTGDMLAASVNPPAIYGNVNFNGGGRTLMDFTDCTVEDLSVGMPVDFSFRIKFYDPKRDITNYFWKAIPAVGEVK